MSAVVRVLPGWLEPVLSILVDKLSTLLDKIVFKVFPVQTHPKLSLNRRKTGFQPPSEPKKLLRMCPDWLILMSFVSEGPYLNPHSPFELFAEKTDPKMQKNRSK